MTFLDATGLVGGLQLVEDRAVPLTRTEPDGRVVDVLCVRVGNKLLVHPDRMGHFRSLPSR